MEWFVIVAAVALVAFILVWRSRQREQRALELTDALADARRTFRERLRRGFPGRTIGR